MRLFNLFKKDKRKVDEISEDEYSMLKTNSEEIIDPTWEQIRIAVDNAQPNVSVFASLSYHHSEHELNTIQVISENDVYRFEAIPSKSSKDFKKIFVNEDIPYKEALNLFESFYKSGVIKGYKDWKHEKNRF